MTTIQTESTKEIIARLYGRGALDQIERFRLKRPESADPTAILRSAVHQAGDPDGVLTVQDRYMNRAGVKLAHVGRSPESTSDRFIVRFVVSSGEDARDNRHVHVEGLDYRAWDDNSVVPWCHIYDELPVGRGLWRGIFKRGATHELWADVEVMPEAINPFAHRVGLALAGGWLRGISLSWISEKVRQEEVNGRTLIATVKGEMIEASVCPIPVDRWGLAEAKNRGVLLPEDLERIRDRDSDWRRNARGLAYEVTPMDVVASPDTEQHDDSLRDALTRAFADDEKRELVDEAHLDPENRLGKLLGYESRAVDATSTATVRAVEDEGKPATSSAVTVAMPKPAAAPARKPSRIDLRGMLSEEVDGLYDELNGGVSTLYEATMRMWHLLDLIFVSGRSMASLTLERAGVDRAVVEQVERFYVSEYGGVAPENADDATAMIRRQLSRADKATERVQESLQGFRDAFNGNLLLDRDEGDRALEDALERALETSARAGAKIAKARLGKLKMLRDLLNEVIEEQEPAANDTKDDDEEERALKSGAAALPDLDPDLRGRIERLAGRTETPAPAAPLADRVARLIAVT